MLYFWKKNPYDIDNFSCELRSIRARGKIIKYGNGLWARLSDGDTPAAFKIGMIWGKNSRQDKKNGARTVACWTLLPIEGEENMLPSVSEMKQAKAREYGIGLFWIIFGFLNLLGVILNGWIKLPFYGLLPDWLSAILGVFLALLVILYFINWRRLSHSMDRDKAIRGQFTD